MANVARLLSVGMANSRISPIRIAPPAANYTHAVLSHSPSRLLHTSGVVPLSPDGVVPGDIGAQARTVWDNIKAMLDEADMAPTDVVSVTTYVIPGQDLGAVMAARMARTPARFSQGPRNR